MSQTFIDAMAAHMLRLSLDELLGDDRPRRRRHTARRDIETQERRNL